MVAQRGMPVEEDGVRRRSAIYRYLFRQSASRHSLFHTADCCSRSAPLSARGGACVRRAARLSSVI